MTSRFQLEIGTVESDGKECDEKFQRYRGNLFNKFDRVVIEVVPERKWRITRDACRFWTRFAAEEKGRTTTCRQEAGVGRERVASYQDSEKEED